MRGSRFLNWAFFGVVLAVAVPLVQHFVAANSISISAKVLSQTSLQTDAATKLTGVAITVDGKEVENPYITTIELSNDGSKPIQPPDFESPIEIRSSTGGKILRAQVASLNPDDLNAKMSWDGDAVRLAPMLLNPRDTVSILIVSAGGDPGWVAKARVAGVTKLSFERTPEKPRNYFTTVLQALLVLALVFCAELGATAVRARKLSIDRKRGLFLSAVSMIAAAIFLMGLLKSLGFGDTWFAASAIAFLSFAVAVTSELTGFTPKLNARDS